MHLRVVCLVDWHLEVFYYPNYKTKNAGVHELNFIHPNIYYRTYFCIMAEKGGTSHGGLTEKLSPFFHAKKQEVNAYGR